jgi:hypothetical protein
VRNISRRSTVLATVLALMCGVLAAGPTTAGARTPNRPTVPTANPWPKNPPHNIEPKPDVNRSSACTGHPRSKACGAQIVRALDHAHAVLGKSAYALTPRFLSLTGRDQLLVLTNDDRRSYGETTIRGRNVALDNNADHWAAREQDPHGVAVVDHHQAGFIGSNLAVGSGPITNPLFAYYLWMYFDGPGGPNADCSSAGAPGCWGHRHVTLYQHPHTEQVLMGVGIAHLGNGEVSWTELYETFSGGANLPLKATVTGLSKHEGGTAGGSTVVVKGFGFSHAVWVHVLKQHAHIVHRSNSALTIRTPAHKPASGYVVVHGTGGLSGRTAAAKFRYHK